MDAKDSFPSPSREAASGDGARTQEDPPQRDPSAATDSAPAADEPAKAPLRRSCVNCTQARKKCQLADGLPEGIAERVCERCQRLGIECEFVQPQKRGPKGPRRHGLGDIDTIDLDLPRRRRTIKPVIRHDVSDTTAASTRKFRSVSAPSTTSALARSNEAATSPNPSSHNPSWSSAPAAFGPTLATGPTTSFAASGPWNPAISGASPATDPAYLSYSNDDPRRAQLPSIGSLPLPTYNPGGGAAWPGAAPQPWTSGAGTGYPSSQNWTPQPPQAFAATYPTYGSPMPAPNRPPYPSQLAPQPPAFFPSTSTQPPPGMPAIPNDPRMHPQQHPPYGNYPQPPNTSQLPPFSFGPQTNPPGSGNVPFPRLWDGWIPPDQTKRNDRN